jgi:hypothetical protein
MSDNTKENTVLTDEELTLIYNEANGIPPGRTGRTPITTERIFTAMRAAMLVSEKQRERWAANQRVVLDERSAFDTLPDDYETGDY